MSNYTPTIGIECHVQLKTRTKLFAAVGNDARNAAPNTLVSHICLGMPGALPVLNSSAIDLCIRAAYALNTKPQKFSTFDRKHYFYPDLPKGYQISQLYQPIIIGGHVDISADGQAKRIGITRAHLEEDAGKNTHPAGKDYSLVDLNRAGTPLLEIVSQPDINSPAEAKAYARELYLLMRYADVSDADLFHGNMRFDVNVSVSNTSELGTRTETKNLNSFKAVEKAVEFEIKRQISLLEKGEAIIQETRGWDDSKQKTFSQRSKEEAHDYRYFPDPDIPPVVLEDKRLLEAENSLPVLPGAWRQKLQALSIDESAIETLLEAEVDDENIHYLPLIDNHLDNAEMAKFLVNFMVNVEIPYRRDENSQIRLSHEDSINALLSIYDLIKKNQISSTKAKELYAELLAAENLPDDLIEYASENGFIQVSDEAELDKIVDQVIEQNPKASEDVRNGELKAIGFLVGQVMKQTQGKANPGIVQKLLKDKLS